MLLSVQVGISDVVHSNTPKLALLAIQRWHSYSFQAVQTCDVIVLYNNNLRYTNE
jgi:hypothetical protein